MTRAWNSAGFQLVHEMTPFNPPICTGIARPRASHQRTSYSTKSIEQEVVKMAHRNRISIEVIGFVKGSAEGLLPVFGLILIVGTLVILALG